MAEKKSDAERIGTLTDPVRVMKRAVRFTCKDESRPILGAVHLDSCSDAVATDAFRLYTEHHVWDGPSMNIPPELVGWIAKQKVSNGTCELSEWLGSIRATMANGDWHECPAIEGAYPNYKQLMMREYKTVAYVKPVQLEAVLKAAARAKTQVAVIVNDHDFGLEPVGESELVGMRVEKTCDGEDVRIGFNAQFLMDGLKAFEKREPLELRIESPLKPAVLKDDDLELLLMPVRLDGAAPTIKTPKQTRNNGKKEENMEKFEIAGEVICITGGLPRMTRETALTRIKAAGGTPSRSFTKSTTVLVVAGTNGKRKREAAEKAIAEGRPVKIIDGTTFLDALRRAEEAAAKPEPKGSPVRFGWVVYGTTADGKVGWVSTSTLKTEKGAECWLKRTAMANGGVELASVRVVYVDDATEQAEEIAAAGSTLQKLCDKVTVWTPSDKRGNGTAETWERPKAEQPNPKPKPKSKTKTAKTKTEKPKPETAKPKPENETIAALEERIAQLEAELKAAQAPTDTAAVVSLEVLLGQMREWCKSHPNTAANRSNGDLSGVRISGVGNDDAGKAMQAELLALGFRWWSKVKVWGYGKDEARAQGKVAVDGR